MKQKMRNEHNLLLSSNAKVSHNLKQLISELNSKKFVDGLKLGVYAPIQNEPVWWESFSADFVKQYLLVHMGDEIKLSYHPVEFEKIKRSEFGLKLDGEFTEKSEVPDIVLVPGLAFTREFERLGRGKGYFDNYLSQFKGIIIGVFYSIQEVETVYSELHDEKLNYIVTEKEIIIRG